MKSYGLFPRKRGQEYLSMPLMRRIYGREGSPQVLKGRSWRRPSRKSLLVVVTMSWGASYAHAPKATEGVGQGTPGGRL